MIDRAGLAPLDRPRTLALALRKGPIAHTPSRVAADDPKETDDVAGAARAAEDPRTMDELDETGEISLSEAEADDASTLETEEQGPPPAQIAELATGCVRFVAARYGVTLDFEPDTLSFVDQWVRDARADLSRRPEAADLVQSSAGAYLGEVIRRAFGGSWVVEGDMAGWRLCLSTVYCAFNPIGMARESLLLEQAEGWHAHFELDPGEREGIEARLRSLPEVDSDEYYAPSTRFDVTEIVIAALRADMQERGFGGVVFAPEDYGGA